MKTANSSNIRTFSYFAVFALIFVGVSYPFRNFLGDDTYIHLVYADSLQNGMGWCFNPGEPSYGSTSPLWTGLIAFFGLPFSNNILVAKVLCYVFSLGTIYVFYLLAKRLIGNPAIVAIALLTLVIDPWFVRWSLSGMESSLKMFLLLSALYIHLRERDNDRSKYLSSLLFALATLARPEVFGIFLIVILDILINEDRTRKFTKLLQFVLVYVVILTPWEIYCYKTFGSLLPHTVVAKDFGFNFFSMKRSITLISKILGGTYILLLVSMVVYVASILFQNGPAWFIRRFVRNHLATALPIVLVLGAYGLRGYPARSIHLLIVIPLLILYGFFALARLIETKQLARFSKVILVAVVVFQVSLSAVLQKKLTYHVIHWPRGVDENLIQLGEWLRDNTPEDALVAVSEIGVIGYFSKRRILDMNCLITPELKPYKREEDGTMRFLVLKKPDYLIFTDSRPVPEYLATRIKHHEVAFSRLVQRGGSRSAGKPSEYTIHKLYW